MKTDKFGPPSTSIEFDKAYSSLSHWTWSDIRIPSEIKELLETDKPKSSLELGCGLGRFSSFIVKQGIKATGVDFSSIAIEKAKKRIANDKYKPKFIVGDVTNLENITEQFDVAFDVGCFHCLNEEDQEKYVNEIYKLLKPQSTLLIWALDTSPSNIKLSPTYLSNVFTSHFELTKSESSRRRVIFVPSHWYWLKRK